MLSLKEKDPSLKLTKLYILALLAIALLSIGSQFVIQMALNEQLHDSYIINMAGRQRMLSQKITKQSLQLERQYNQGRILPDQIQELAASLELWELFHKGLIKRDSGLKLSGENSDEILYLFSAIEPYFSNIHDHVGSIQNLITKTGNSDAIFREVNAILQNEKLYLNGMDQIVKQYELEARQKVTSTKLIELFVLLTVLLVLLLEGLFIFKPAANRIKESFYRLKHTSNELKNLNRELEIKIRDRTREISNKNNQLADKNIKLNLVNQDLDNFVYTASHDLKAPINNLEGLINTLESSVPEVMDKAAPILDMMHESIDRFKLVLADLSDTGKAKQEILGTTETVKLEELFDEVISNINNLVKESDAAIITDFSAAPEIKFLRKNLRSIFHNLISNAIKYRSPNRLPLVKVASKRSGDYILLKISDNGLGMKTEDLNKIFSMYSRIHHHVEGTGVGLSLVKKIVDENAGKIEVRSRVDKGTAFCIYLKDVP